MNHLEHQLRYSNESSMTHRTSIFNTVISSAMRTIFAGNIKHHLPLHLCPNSTCTHRRSSTVPRWSEKKFINQRKHSSRVTMFKLTPAFTTSTNHQKTRRTFGLVTSDGQHGAFSRVTFRVMLRHENFPVLRFVSCYDTRIFPCYAPCHVLTRCYNIVSFFLDFKFQSLK